VEGSPPRRKCADGPSHPIRRRGLRQWPVVVVRARRFYDAGAPRGSMVQRLVVTRSRRRALWLSPITGLSQDRATARARDVRARGASRP
jgi:hypothetical protein